MNPEVKVKLTFVGDLLCHNDLTKLCHSQESNAYDFKPIVSSVKKYFTYSDYVIGNLETPLAQRNTDIFPLPTKGFNAPCEYLEAFIDAGIDLFITGNNHSYDQGEKGLLSTLEILDLYDVDHIGTYASPENAEEIFIKDIHGIKIAFISYTFGINYNVHGNILPTSKSYQINFLAPPEYHEFEDWWNLLPSFLNLPLPKVLRTRLTHTSEKYNYHQQTSKVISDINLAKKLGADVVILLPHMGIECTTRPLRFVRKWVEKMFASGADIIIGGHTHSLQPMEFWNIADNDGMQKKGFVIYSLGNFVSQDIDYCPDKLSAMSIILNIDLKKDTTTKKVTIDSVSCIPTWIHREDKTKPVHVVTIPDALKQARETDNKKTEDKLLTIQDKIYSILTQNTLKVPCNDWTFSQESSLQRKEKWIYSQDIQYLIHGFPRQVIGTLYNEFGPFVKKLLSK